ncbi:MAG: helix-turn-helix domain-containing protein, partial [Thermoplasmataceae archaeon]
MEEIDLKLVNDLPFCRVSQRFPDATMLRWCNSAVDYLEFYAGDDTLDRISEALPDLVASLKSRIIFKSRKENRISVMVACRCTRQNSTIRMAEFDSCLWKAPVKYEKGEENLSVVSLEAENFRQLFDDLNAVGTVEIERKQQIDPESLRDVYTLSMSQLFNPLTGKQMEYLLNAISAGYFSIPRKIELGELATHMGISKSTLQEHVSKATTKVMAFLEPYLRLYLGIQSGKGE